MKKVLLWVVGILVALMVLGAVVGEKKDEQSENTVAVESKPVKEPHPDGLDEILGADEEEKSANAEEKPVDLSKKYQKEIKEYNKLKKRKLEYLFDTTSGIASAEAKKIAVGFSAVNNIPEGHHDSFYRCLGDMTRSKSKDLEISKVLEWCLINYEQNPEQFLVKQSNYSYFELRKDFSDWDGSHKPSVKAIKSSMSDPESFKHQKTLTRFAAEEEGFFMYVQTTFSGKNQFGGQSVNVVLIKINPETGKLVSIEVQD